MPNLESKIRDITAGCRCLSEDELAVVQFVVDRLRAGESPCGADAADDAIAVLREQAEAERVEIEGRRKAAVVAMRPPDPSPDAMVPAGPCIKWAGGKTKLLPELLARVPAQFGRYYEPFAGGAALFFGLAPERAVISDSNADLINMYRALVYDVEAIIDRLEAHRADHCEEHYYHVRRHWKEPAIGPLERAAAFIYLNRTCFNGLWRVNRAGVFNVPMGRYVGPLSCVSDKLRAAAPHMARATLRCGDFRSTVSDATAGDFIYFDPPYDPVNATSNFTSYIAGSFGPDDQRALADTARALVARGCQVMLSNSDTPLIRSLYDGFTIDRVMCGRAINANGGRRGEVAELIITSPGCHAGATSEAA